MKKRRLKKWVVKMLMVITILVTVAIIYAVSEASDRFDQNYSECDQINGYTCSYYEARQYSLGK